MPSDNSCNMWVFREGQTTISGKAVVGGLHSALAKVPAARGGGCDALVEALLRAGELECGLADATAPAAQRAAAVTDALAAALLDLPGWEMGLEHALAMLHAVATPEYLNISPQEGFAYYALNPLDFVELVDEVPVQGAEAAVVGIRTIGTTLSAVVTAALRRRGLRAERVTVRPTGHPYDRRTTLTPEQLRWIASRQATEASFWVVDEGPGISGSSFLSVGDALLQAGVARERITFLGSRYPDPDKLVARDGAARWQSFRFMVTRATAHTPADRGAYLGGGEWRRRFYAEEAQWPAAWVQMERLKLLSSDGRRLYKFHGLGRFGEPVAERARLLGAAGFGPELLSHASGFSEFELIDGQPMEATHLSAAMLERIADYCALRAQDFGVRPAPESQLDAMVRFNVGEEFGCDAGASLPQLVSERPVIADGRMLPHEWLATPGGRLVKSDNATHGDDHFFPGPVDIAWDLAGAIIEWGMTTEAARYMLDRYRQRSGDDARARMNAFRLAYAVFRMAYCAMAAFAMRGWEEEQRLQRAAQHYRKLVETQLKAPGCRLLDSAKRNSEWREQGASAQGVLAMGDGGADSG